MLLHKYSKTEEIEMFEAYLDSAYDPVEIEGLKFNPSDVLAQCAPTAYDDLFENFAEHQNWFEFDEPSERAY